MGHIQHNAIIATTWSDDRADEFAKWITSLSGKHQRLFVRASSVINDYHTFVLTPDGSKEGWDESDEGDTLRELVKSQLRSYNYEDGSSPWTWCEVSYGEDESELLDDHIVEEDETGSASESKEV